MEKSVKIWCFIGIVAISLLVAAIVTHSVTGGDIPFDYGVVMDAGSSHTEILLYKWLSDQVRNTGVVHEITSCESKQGIDANGADVDKIIANIDPCFNNITQLIGDDETGSSQVLLGATAGMRVLSMQNPTLATLIFNSIHGYMLKFEKDKRINDPDNFKSLDIKMVRILTGQEEAVYAWVGANYLAKKLIITTDPATVEVKEDTVGIIDMGGASVQIAYLDKAGVLPKDKVVNTRLYGIDYKIRASSNLCWGGNKAWARYLASVIIDSRNPNSDTIESPCLPDGGIVTINGTELLDDFCLQLVEPQKLEDKIKRKLYALRGTSNSLACGQAMKTMMNINECKNRYKTCFEMEETAPPTGMTFYGKSALYQNTKGIIGETTTQLDFVTKTDEHCRKPWETIKTGNQKDDVYMMRKCTMLYYIYETLTTVYRFSNSQFSQIKFKNKIDGHSLGWAIGLMINATNLIPPEKPTEPVISSTVLIVISVICIVVILAWIVVLLRSTKNRRTEGLTIN